MRRRVIGGLHTSNGEVLQGKDAVKEKFGKYIEELRAARKLKLQIRTLGEGEAKSVSRGGGNSVRAGECTDTDKNEVLRALRRMKGGSSPGFHMITLELLRKRYDCVMEEPGRLFDMFWIQGDVCYLRMTSKYNDTV